MSRTWLITGAGRGLGRAFVDAVLDHGDRVVATARRPEPLAAELARFGDRALAVALDVNDKAAVDRVVRDAADAMGSLDVVVNNAGYGMSGGVEEVNEREARDQFDTNFFGALWVTQAALPVMRAQGRGHIIQISSVAGIVGLPNLGIYSASKFALEGMSQALAQEVAPFGIRVTLVEPSGFRTDWNGASMHRATPMAAYDDVLGSRRAAYDPSSPRVMTGDPELAAQALISIVESDDPALQVPLGKTALELTRSTYAARTEALRGLERLALSVEAPR